MAACESDHDSLAPRASGGSGGVAGRGGASGAQGGFTVIGKGGSSGNQNSGGRAPDEPPGDDVFTFLHGIVDAERVKVCFVSGEGDDARVLGEPAPEEGLYYGERLVVGKLDGADFSKDAIQPFVIAGELERVRGLDCVAALELARAEQDKGTNTGSAGAAGAGGATGSGGGTAGGAGGTTGAAGSDNVAGTENFPDSRGSGGSFSALIDAGGSGGEGGAEPPLPEPPVLRVGALPSMSVGTLAQGRSVLFAATGCIGGPAFDGRHAKAACGESYTPRAPTLSAVVVPMSRRASPFGLGLQAVHASVGSVPWGLVDLEAESQRENPPPPIYIGSSISLGAIVPRMPRTDLPSNDYGAKEGDGRLIIFSSSGPLFAEPWSTTLERASLTSLEDGINYALVMIGPRFDLRRRGFWNAPAIAIVPTDPPLNEPFGAGAPK